MNHRLSRTRQATIRGLGLVLILALGLLWEPTPTLAAAPETRTYTVQPGDTLYKLSVRFGTTVDELVALNDIRDPNLIYVGQVLLVPAMGGDAGSAPTQPAPPPAGGPLSFTWARVGWRYEGRDYFSKLHVTATGGQPPYTFYHDGLVLTDAVVIDSASVTFEVASRRGHAKPGSVGVADSTGNYVKQEYWLRDPCDYPAGVEITRPKEDAELKHYPRNFNIEWRHTIDSPPDAYWIEIQVWDDGWKPFKTYRHTRGDRELFFVPDPFPGDLGGRLRMWGIYGVCEADTKTPWRYFEFRVTF